MAAKKKSTRRSAKKTPAAAPSATAEQVQQVLGCLTPNPSSSSELAEKSGLPAATVRLALQTLIDQGQVYKEGQYRWTRYTLAPGKTPVEQYLKATGKPPKATPPTASKPKPPAAAKPAAQPVKREAPKLPEPSTAREAVLSWLASPESSIWDNAQEVSKNLAVWSGFPRMDIQAEIRELTKQGKIEREFCKSPGGQYRRIKRAG